SHSSYAIGSLAFASPRKWAISEGRAKGARCQVFEDKIKEIKLNAEFEQFRGRLDTQGTLWAEAMLRAKNAKESINNISANRMEWIKSKGRRFFISDQRLFHKQTFDSYDL